MTEHAEDEPAAPVWPEPSMRCLDDHQRSTLIEAMVTAARFAPPSFDPVKALDLVANGVPARTWQREDLDTSTHVWMKRKRYVDEHGMSDHIEDLAAAVLVVGEAVLRGRHDLLSMLAEPNAAMSQMRIAQTTLLRLDLGLERNDRAKAVAKKLEQLAEAPRVTPALGIGMVAKAIAAADLYEHDTVRRERAQQARRAQLEAEATEAQRLADEADAEAVRVSDEAAQHALEAHRAAAPRVLSYRGAQHAQIARREADEAKAEADKARERLAQL